MSFIKNKSCLSYQGGQCTLTQETNPEKSLQALTGRSNNFFIKFYKFNVDYE